jgi:hypothetical protein
MVDVLRAPTDGEEMADASMTADDSGRIWLDGALAALPVALLEAK